MYSVQVKVVSFWTTNQNNTLRYLLPNQMESNINNIIKYMVSQFNNIQKQLSEIAYNVKNIHCELRVVIKMRMSLYMMDMNILLVVH